MANRLHVSREFAKRYGYMVLYGWDDDPWITTLVGEELNAAVLAVADRVGYNGSVS